MSPYNHVFTEQAILLAKLESNKNQAAVPSASADAIVVSNLSAQLVKSEMINHSPLRGYKGTWPKIVSNPYAEISFDISMPTKDKESSLPWERLIIACGFKTGNFSKNKAKFLQTSDEQSNAITFYYYIAGNLYSIKNARGNAVIVLSSGELPIIRFRFIGILSSIIEKALPSANTSKWEKPIPLDHNHTSITLNQKNLGFRKVSINIGNSLRFVNRIDNRNILIESRTPSGSIIFDHTDKDFFDPFYLSENQSLSELEISHGSSDNEKWNIFCPHVQLLDPKLEKDGNISTVSCSMAIHQKEPNNSDNPFDLRIF